MTQAVCFKCGAIKFGAFTACKSCDGTPQSDEDLIMSLAMTDHYFDEKTLQQMGDDIRAGKKLTLHEETRRDLLKMIEQSPLTAILRAPPAPIKKKGWWPF
ncbi:MAG: hypothetical protein WCI21_01575 [Alphaproteobacteria bacterium]